MTEKIQRIFIRTPPRFKARLPLRLIWALVGLLLTPFSLGLAALMGAPGLAVRMRCSWLGLNLLLSPTGRYPRAKALWLLLNPMDSTRYFEFDFVKQATTGLPLQRYLDVSSPRMVPILLALSRPNLKPDLLNPDVADLAETRELLAALDLDRRVMCSPDLISAADFAPDTFDLITCISVLEHIPEDSAAVSKMWSLLKPGGKLILTVPCLVSRAEQYIDLDTYKLLTADHEGYVFWQRFYDVELLEERVFSLTGKPAECRIYGEKIQGTFFFNAQRKRRNFFYPFWLEPIIMAKDYRDYESVEQLPGDGVIAMTFVKK